MARNISCPLCGETMKFLRDEEIQLGSHSFFFGDLGNLVAGSLRVTIYVCPRCNKLEFFYAGDPIDWPTEENTGGFVEGSGPLVPCPRCGKKHHKDDSACPLCGLPQEELN